MKKTEAEQFDAVVRTMLSVSHEEIQKCDKAWTRKRAQKKRSKTPAGTGHKKDI